MADVRGIVGHMCALARDPRNRATIVKVCFIGFFFFYFFIFLEKKKTSE
jgi:hypothetical protein